MAASKSTCSTCGYQWKTGANGSHSCGAVLRKKITKAREEIVGVSSALVAKAVEGDVVHMDHIDDAMSQVLEVLDAI